MTEDERKQKAADRRELRQERRTRLLKYVPVLRLLCEKNDILFVEIDGGYQISKNEYVVSWWPATNKVRVRGKGEGEDRPFEPGELDKKPKILVAIEKLIRVTRGRVPDVGEPNE